MAGSEPPAPLPRLVLVGGDGHASGVPRHIGHLCAALAGQARITVISEANQGGYDDLSGATHLPLPGLRSRMHPAHLWRGVWGLRRALRAEAADLTWLHARLPVLFGRALLALGLWRPRGAVAVTYHGLPFGPGHKPLADRISRGLERGLLRLCPPLDLIFLTEEQAAGMRAAMGGAMTRHRVHVLPNCSDLGPLPDVARPPGRHLVMTGRCGWQKDYPLALRLFAHLPERFTLTLCGAGTEAAAFRAEAAALLPAPALARLRFAGPLPDVRPVLAAADGYLLTSRYEGLPIGALEAWEAGLPLALRRFEGAEALAEGHPIAEVLDFTDLARDAARIAEMTEAYVAARTERAAVIKAGWAARWSPRVFARNARALVADIVPRVR